MKLLQFTFIYLAGALLSCCQHSQCISQKNLTTLLHERFIPKTISTTPYLLYSWIPKHPSHSSTIRIYIEGDGNTWVKNNRTSQDPTPKNKLVYRLMLKDPKNDIAYLARPCQYIKNKHCKPYVWTFGRYDLKVVESMNQAINIIMKNNYSKLELVGFSGGATIALALGKMRRDITSIRTIAGNLEPKYTNNYHHVSPMPSAINIVLLKPRLSTIPQLHFIGENDTVIPINIYNHYKKHINSTCINHQIIKGASHSSGWENHWQNLLKQDVLCGQ